MLIFPLWLLLAICLLCHSSFAATNSWPCLTLPTKQICHDDQPCQPGPLGPLGPLVCPPPGCTSDSECGSVNCAPGTAPRQCEDFQDKNANDQCSTHIECGPDKICTNPGKVCYDVPKGSPLDGSSFKRCDTNKQAVDCGVLEECEPNPGATTGPGVCLIKTTNPQAKTALLSGTTGPPGGGTLVKEGQPCTSGVTKCETPFYCESGKCVKTLSITSDLSGHRMPPQPGDPNCRDALDSGETDEAGSKCKDRENLCTEPLYIELMKEQCPKTCGYCADPSLDLTEYAEEESGEVAAGGGTIQRTGGTGVKTVKVDPSASCSDRKLPGKESDCSNLKQLCTDSIYRALMEEQCPKTCGFCT